MEENKKQETVTETAPMPAASQSEQPTVESPAVSYMEENVSAVDAKPQKIAKMETAEKRITKHLAAQNITPQEESIRTALIPLYERYELTGAAPTQSAFAEAMKRKGPTWIECIIDKDEKVLPMIPGGGDINDIIMK